MSSLGDDGLKRRRKSNGGRGCLVTEVAICENVGQDCGNGTIAVQSTEKTIEGKKKTINLDLDKKDWFLYGESGANYGSPS
ncbi:hypothetical protein AVEN_182891-1 [Araneus ventricosus]|uniref:Uncharacterized protein n=1 Tax=Araneus ventricosus TaxID=182803 RepID=A0A4Y2JC51_ARAVE|nr:hypothetical protein AVEN_182891-1 [Araneus ventricosus]